MLSIPFSCKWKWIHMEADEKVFIFLSHSPSFNPQWSLWLYSSWSHSLLFFLLSDSGKCQAESEDKQHQILFQIHHIMFKILLLHTLLLLTCVNILDQKRQNGQTHRATCKCRWRIQLSEQETLEPRQETLKNQEHIRKLKKHNDFDDSLHNHSVPERTWCITNSFQ